ncbi:MULTISPECIES: LysR family transcriptional regulator [Polaromonas]|uniref:LysR family transcriptional regulator n=1 Tax=Polaromonas aquatica TaxID=332657 RepID=A0ABW1TZ27_9BURK
MHQQLNNRLRSKLRLRHMELLDVLGETLNIHQAAPRLSLSQPAASKLLHEIESLYEARFFDRLPRGLRATAAGETAIRWARLCLHNMGESVAEAHLVAGGATGRVRVGVLPVAIPTLFADVLKRAREEVPKLVVTVTEGGNEAMLPALARNELDLVLGRLTPNMDSAFFTSERLYDESVSLVVRKDHPVLRKRKISLKDLGDLEWILQPELAPMRRQLDELLLAQGLPRPNPKLETSSVLLTTMTLMQTDMVAMLPSSVARLYELQGPLKILQVPLPVVLPPVGLVLPFNRMRSPVVSTFIDIVRQTARLQ